MIHSTEYFTANNADIAAMCERTEHFLREQGLERREIERMRLTLETLLRRIGERLGWATRCSLTLGRRMGRARVELRYAGDAFDPALIGRESEGEAWSAQLLADVGLVPLWSRRGGVNCLVLEPPARRRSVWLGTLLAAALALLTGFMPEKWAEIANRAVLAPLLGCFADVLSTFAGVLILFSLVALVCGVGDTLTLGADGQRMTGRFFVRTAFWTALGTAGMALLCFPGALDAAKGGASLLRGFVPRDPASPFLRGEVRQILFLGLLFGAAVHALGARAARVREAAEQGFAVCVRCAEYVFALLPLLIFAALARLLRQGSFAALAKLWRPLEAYAVCALAILAVKLLVSCVKQKENALELLRSLRPACLSALSTASSAAAFGRTMDSCENALGVPHELVLNGLSVGGRLCAPFTALCFPAALLYLTADAGAALGVGELALLALLGAALAVALPPLRGAILLPFGMLLSLFGLPEEGFAAAVLLSAVLDPIAAACANAYLQLELLCQKKQ